MSTPGTPLRGLRKLTTKRDQVFVSSYRVIFVVNICVNLLSSSYYTKVNPFSVQTGRHFPRVDTDVTLHLNFNRDTMNVKLNSIKYPSSILRLIRNTQTNTVPKDFRLDYEDVDIVSVPVAVSTVGEIVNFTGFLRSQRDQQLTLLAISVFK